MYDNKTITNKFNNYFANIDKLAPKIGCDLNDISSKTIKTIKAA